MKLLNQLMTFLDSYNIATKEEKIICDKIIQMSSINKVSEDFKQKIEKVVKQTKLEQNKEFYNKKKKQAAYMKKYYRRKKQEKMKPIALKFEETDDSFDHKVTNK